MNMNDLQKEINQRLNESKAFTLMNNFHEVASRYPVAYIEFKPKREAAIIKMAEPLYPVHTVFGTPKNDYASSVVLVGNEIVIPFMAREVATFVFHLENFYKEIKKANNVQELAQYYKQFTLKPKQLLDALVSDAKLYAKRYKFELDVKAMITEYNDHKAFLAKPDVK